MISDTALELELAAMERDSSDFQETIMQVVSDRLDGCVNIIGSLKNTLESNTMGLNKALAQGSSLEELAKDGIFLDKKELNKRLEDSGLQNTLSRRNIVSLEKEELLDKFKRKNKSAPIYTILGTYQSYAKAMEKIRELRKFEKQSSETLDLPGTGHYNKKIKFKELANNSKQTLHKMGFTIAETRAVFKFAEIYRLAMVEFIKATRDYDLLQTNFTYFIRNSVADLRKKDIPNIPEDAHVGDDELRHKFVSTYGALKHMGRSLPFLYRNVIHAISQNRPDLYATFSQFEKSINGYEHQVIEAGKGMLAEAIKVAGDAELMVEAQTGLLNKDKAPEGLYA